MEVQKKYLTVRECADELGVDKKTIRRWIKAKQFPIFRPPGAHPLIPVPAWEQFKARFTT